MKDFLKVLKKAVVLSLVMMVLCGIIYPLALTGIGQLVFPKQANGSIIEVNGETVGSELIGQQFSDERFFKGRVSNVSYNTYEEVDVAEGNYGGVSSGGSNYAASNPALEERVEADLAAFLEANPTVKQEEIPTDLLTASGSGLDPHISPDAAAVQIPAVAKATGLSEEDLQGIVKENTEGKWLGIFGEHRVNVLKTNLAVAKAIKII